MTRMKMVKVTVTRDYALYSGLSLAASMHAYIIINYKGYAFEHATVHVID